MVDITSWHIAFAISHRFFPYTMAYANVDPPTPISQLLHCVSHITPVTCRYASGPNIRQRPTSDAISRRSQSRVPFVLALSPLLNPSNAIFLYKAFSLFLEEMPPFSKDKGNLIFAITSSLEVHFSSFKLQYIQNEKIHAMGLFPGASLDFHFPLWGTL